MQPYQHIHVLDGALSFYLHRGSSTYGILEGFPPGSRRYYLQKQLEGAPKQAAT